MKFAKETEYRRYHTMDGLHFIHRAGSSNNYFNAFAVTGIVKAVSDASQECSCE